MHHNVSLNVALPQREIGSISNQHNFKTYAFSNVPRLLKPKSKYITTIDKIFSCEWYNETEVITGGKDNKLLKWDIVTKEFSVIDLPSMSYSQYPSDGCGIHSIITNTTTNQLITGASNPNELIILNLSDFKPQMILSGHTDWVFSSVMIGDCKLATGSRDGTIKLWSTTHIPDPLNTLPKRKSLLSRRKHSGKVRYVSFSPSKQILSSISYDCSLLLWDVESMDTCRTYNFDGEQTLLTSTFYDDRDLLIVGHSEGMTLFDLNSELVTDIPPPPNPFTEVEVRSVSVSNDIITAGCTGYLGFYDLRAAKWMELTGGRAYVPLKPPSALSVSTIYDHKWKNNRLLCAGGPLHSMDYGAFVSSWEI